MAKVTLLTHTPMPEQTIAAAAKLCYSAAEIDKIYEGLTPEKTASFVEMLSEIGHESPIEHASFTFGIELPRAVSWAAKCSSYRSDARRMSCTSK